MNEHQQIEWKESWRDDYLKWISGFANAQGGVLVIGKNDRGEVTGVKNAARLLEDLPNKIRDVLGILVEVNLHRKNSLEYIEIVTEPYPYPISYQGRYFLRSGSTTQELRGAALDRFLLSRQGKRWDGVPIPNVSIKDLDKSAIARFRERASGGNRLTAKILKENDRQLLDKLHLIEGPYLKRAALLLFHSDPERFVTGAFVKIGFFETDSDLRYHDEIHGDLFTQVDGTMELLLTKYLKAKIEYEGIQRIESLPIPEEALREALLNAVAHKDYNSHAPIQISVYDDKILFWNNGELHEGWTIKNLTSKHASQPFNPDIANVFFRAGMIESWGRGIEKMMDACKQHGAPKPRLRYEKSGLWVEFVYKKPEKSTVKGSEKSSVETSGETSGKTVEKASEKTSEKTSGKTSGKNSGKTSGKTSGKNSGKNSGKTSGKILLLMEDNPEITIPEIANQLNKTERAIEMQINNMKKNNEIKRVGPAKGGHWEVLK